MSPQLSLHNGDTLSFWTRTVTTPSYPDRLQVRLSTAGASTNVGTSATDVGDFTTLLLDINPTLTTGGYPNVWTQYTITLSGLPAAGATGRFAWRYFVTDAGTSGTNSDYIGIDTVQFDSSGSSTCLLPSDMPWLSVSPASGTTAAGDTSTVQVTFDASAVPYGTYTGNLCINSNDPDPGPGNGTNQVVIAVSLTIPNPNYGSGGGCNFANFTPGAAGSPWGQPVYNWITQQSNSITSWTSGDGDDGYLAVDLSTYLGGTGFPYFGTNCNQLFISSNGFMSVGTTPPSNNDYGQDPFPNVAAPNTVVAGAWMDLDMQTSSFPETRVYYGGDASKFVVTYWHVHHWASAPRSDYLTYQITLYRNGRIVVRNNQAESSGTTTGSPTIEADAVIGIENSTGTDGIGYRVDGVGGPMFGSPMALAIVPDGLPVGCPDADLNNDGQVNVLDITLVANRWNNPGSYNPAYDLNCDGVIDMVDITLVTAALGT